MRTHRHKKEDLSVIQESYVECIADAEASHGHAHVSLLAEELGVSKPSVVQMIARLDKVGIVTRHEKEIALTRRGQQIAKELEGRHRLLQEFMMLHLGMDETSANNDACCIEHVVSQGFVRGLRDFLKKGK